MKFSSVLKNIAVVGMLSFAILAPAKADVNVRVDALSGLMGVANIQVDFGISTAWTLGPTFQYRNRTVDDYESTAYGIGIRENYYLNGNVFTQGWYLGPSVGYIRATVKRDDSVHGDIEGSASGIAATFLAGYQWMWESFNMNLGAGPVYYTIGNVKVENGDGTYDEEYKGYSGLGIALEFSLGWKF